MKATSGRDSESMKARPYTSSRPSVAAVGMSSLTVFLPIIKIPDMSANNGLRIRSMTTRVSLRSAVSAISLLL